MGVGRNLYVDLDGFQRLYANSLAMGTPDATEIEREIEAASRAVDEICRRPDGFFATTDTRYFAGDGCEYITIPDLLAATSIKLDEDGNRTFELTLNAASDYFLKRYGHADEDATPWNRLALDQVNGARSSFVQRERLVEIVGRWGYGEDVERLTPTITLASGSTTTATLSAAGDVANGQTLRVAATAEQLYVSAGGGTTSLTVVRGVNGTSPLQAAATASALDRYTYPAKVREVTLDLAGKAWMRRSDPARIVAGTPLAGTDRKWAERELSSFIRWSTMVD